MSLAEAVQVDRRFARSARLDTDLGRVEAIEGFVIQPSIRHAFMSMADAFSSGQGAFTWTGPYGGGKSSAALMLAAMLGPDSPARKLAIKLIDPETLQAFSDAFPRTRAGWRVVALSGRRAALNDDLAERISANDDLLDSLRKAATADESDGLVLIVDELGKYLEHAALEATDMHILQDVAELAARSHGRLLVIGILHQSFERYAARLSRMAREEWAKIQGRYQDIPFASASEETLDLISRAITAKARPSVAGALAERVAYEIQQRRGSAPAALATMLGRCWPLHPVVALLLGPIARHRFGQNERSVFGFLGSAEPHGFQDFLRSAKRGRETFYSPPALFDYLAANLGPAILSSNEGHRFATSLDAVDRAAARGGDLHVAIAKTAAVIELFGTGTGLTGAGSILAASMPDAAEREVAAALEDLCAWSVLVHRRHLGAYAIHAGSDFDLDAAVTERRSEAGHLDIADRLALPPIVAKRHYYRTGTLRWFDVAIYPLPLLEEQRRGGQSVRRNGLAERHAKAFDQWRAARREYAALILAIKPPEMAEAEAEMIAAALSRREGETSIAVGMPRSSYLLRELAAELTALERVASQHPHLEGDAIARREVSARVMETAGSLEQEVRRAFDSAKWFAAGERARDYDELPLSAIASAEADAQFSETPLIRNELINRERPASNAMAALRALLHAMALERASVRLGITEFPPEYALYATILQQVGLHRVNEAGEWSFCPPDDGEVGKSFAAAWAAAERLPAGSSIADLYAVWKQAPIGMRSGPMPLLAFAWILANESKVAVYLEGLFTPVIDDFLADRLLQSPGEITIRRIEVSREKDVLLGGLARMLQARGAPAEITPLSVAKGIVRIGAQLPKWTQRTKSVSEDSRRLLDSLLSADDPHDLLFERLTFLGETPADRIERIEACLLEVDAAYAAMLSGLERALAASLGCDTATFAGVQRRAAAVQGISGDLRLDAFALRVGNLEGLEHRQPAIEGLASFLVHRPPQQWTDQDVDKAHAELARSARRFRETEAMAMARGRSTGAEALALIVAGRGGEPVLHSFEVSGVESRQAAKLAKEVVAQFEHLNHEVQLAALAELLRLISAAEARECEAAE